MTVNFEALLQKISKSSRPMQVKMLEEVYTLGLLQSNHQQVIPSELSEGITLTVQGKKIQFGNRWIKEEQCLYVKNMGNYSASLSFTKKGYKKATEIILSTNITGTIVIKRLAAGYRQDLLERANAVLYNLCNGDKNKIKML